MQSLSPCAFFGSFSFGPCLCPCSGAKLPYPKARDFTPGIYKVLQNVSAASSTGSHWIRSLAYTVKLESRAHFPRVCRARG